VGIGIPRPVDFERTGGLASGVAQVGVDAPELALQGVDRVERVAAANARDRRSVQTPAGDQQEREARAGLLVADADVPSLVDLSAGCRPALLREQGRRR